MPAVRGGPIVLSGSSAKFAGDELAQSNLGGTGDGHDYSDKYRHIDNLEPKGARER